MITCDRTEFAPESCDWPDEPSLTLLRGGKLTRLKTRSAEANELSSFDFGVRTVFSQLCTTQLPDGGAVRTLGVTSCNPQEGKSTIALALATIAAERQRVLLITAADAQLFPVGDEARRLPNRGTGELIAALTQSSIRELMRDLPDRFDLIVVDLPSVNRSGCLEWAAALDGMLLVIQSERVRWQLAARGVALLEQAGGHVLGSIINKRRNYIPESIYRQL